MDLKELTGVGRLHAGHEEPMILTAAKASASVAGNRSSPAELYQQQVMTKIHGWNGPAACSRNRAVSTEAMIHMPGIDDSLRARSWKWFCLCLLWASLAEADAAYTACMVHYTGIQKVGVDAARVLRNELMCERCNASARERCFDGCLRENGNMCKKLTLPNLQCRLHNLVKMLRTFGAPLPPDELSNLQ